MTNKHDELTYKAYKWIRNKTTKCVFHFERNIISQFQYGMIPDGYAIVTMNSNIDRQLNEKIINRIYEKQKGRHSVKFFARQVYIRFKRIHKYPDHYSPVLVAFESKATIADFKNTFVNGNHSFDRREYFADYHYLVCSKEVYDYIESTGQLPDWWGVLIEKGTGLAVARPTTYTKITDKMRADIALNLMLWYSAEVRSRKWKEDNMCKFTAKADKKR